MSPASLQAHPIRTWRVTGPAHRLPWLIAVLVPIGLRAAAEPPPASPPPKTTVIEGQVFNAYGAGVSGAQVRISRPAAATGPGPTLATAVTNETGDFQLTITEVVTGKVLVTINAAGYAPATHELEIDPDDDLPPFVDVELAGSGVMAGLVRDARSDKPIAGASILVTLVFRQMSAQADAQGVFTVEGLLPGEVMVTADAKGFGREQSAVRVDQGPDGKTSLELPPPEEAPGAAAMSLDDTGRLIVSLKPERIAHLRTVDDQGQAVGGVVVECLDEGRRDFRTLATDADGKLTIRGLNFDTRSLALRLSHERYVSSQDFDRTLELPADPVESSHTLVMQPAGVLTGTITDRATRQPLNGARIMVGGGAFDAAPRDWSDFEGRFRITGVTPGKQPVTVHLADYAPELVEADIAAGQTASVDLKLDPAASVGGMVVDAQGNPVPEVHVMAAKWRNHETLGLQALTGADGRFLIPNAPADEFTVTFRHVRYEPLENQPVQAPKTDHRFALTAAQGRAGMPEVKLKVGDEAPPFELTALDGRAYKLADLKGKTVFLDFWATWCGPCVAEIPNVRAVHDAFAKRDDFILLGVSLDRERADLERFVKQKKIDWPQAVGKEGGAEQAADAYGVFGIPAIYLIGPDGRIRALDLRGPEMKDRVAQALDAEKTR